MKTRPVVLILAVLALLGGLALGLLGRRLRPYASVARKVPWLFTSRDPACSFAQRGRAIWASVFDQPPAVNRMRHAMRLLERDAGGPELWETPRGRFWIPKGNAWSLAYLLMQWDHRVKSERERGVRSGDIVLDCGANVGTYTRELLADGAKLVVAIEPAPENLECLRRTFAGEIADGRVILCPKGVWDREENRMMSLNPGSSLSDSVVVRNKDSRQETTVPLTTIDQLVAELRLPRVDFIKMDIEGAEQRALTGAGKTLSRFKPRLAISGYHLPGDSVRIPAIVRQAQPGYQLERGECAVKSNRIAPETLFFR